MCNLGKITVGEENWTQWVGTASMGGLQGFRATWGLLGASQDPQHRPPHLLLPSLRGLPLPPQLEPHGLLAVPRTFQDSGWSSSSFHWESFALTHKQCSLRFQPWRRHHALKVVSCTFKTAHDIAPHPTPTPTPILRSLSMPHFPHRPSSP